MPVGRVLRAGQTDQGGGDDSNCSTQALQYQAVDGRRSTQPVLVHEIADTHVVGGDDHDVGTGVRRLRATFGSLGCGRGDGSILPTVGEMVRLFMVWCLWVCMSFRLPEPPDHGLRCCREEAYAAAPDRDRRGSFL